MKIYTSEKEMLKAQYSDIVSDGGLGPRDKFAKREWVGLNGEEVNHFAAGCHLGNSVQDAIRKAEAKLKEKNT